MDIRKVKKLIELVEESGIAELEISEGEDSVRIIRHTSYAVAPVAAVQAPPPVATQAAAVISPVEDITGNDDGHSVTAPMVGTFYNASGPGAAPFVQIGDQVSAGETLCIIEAMKMMNPIEADTSGTIKSIRCQNAEPVEFGQVLFVIDSRGQ